MSTYCMSKKAWPIFIAVKSKTYIYVQSIAILFMRNCHTVPTGWSGPVPVSRSYLATRCERRDADWELSHHHGSFREEICLCQAKYWETNLRSGFCEPLCPHICGIKKELHSVPVQTISYIVILSQTFANFRKLSHKSKLYSTRIELPYISKYWTLCSRSWLSATNNKDKLSICCKLQLFGIYIPLARL